MSLIIRLLVARSTARRLELLAVDLATTYFTVKEVEYKNREKV